ncbi:MAG: peptidylprolyl isomerase [Bifidobacteriaceae bacterium]|jgi:peptidyl-prolyl cis-trans isomerase B (cyclophilin B)|nr:peptidylprolyl isomerase [Bifidobacteriaceae bacterium]
MSQKRQRYQRKVQYHVQQRTSAKKMRAYYALFAVMGVAVAAAIGLIVWAYLESNTIPNPLASQTSSEAPVEDAQQNPEESQSPTGTNTGNVPLSSLAQNKTGTMTLELSQGTLEIELDGALAPQAVSSMIYLAQTNWYPDNKASCTRLTSAETFKLLQCGGPNGDQAGGPGYSYGPIENAPQAVEQEGTKFGVYTKGMVAMARQSSNGYSMGSQFFIMYGDTYIPEDAAGGYSVIGQVVKGQEILDEIAAKGLASDATDSSDGPPADAVDIKKVSVSGWPEYTQSDYFAAQSEPAASTDQTTPVPEDSADEGGK